MSCTRNFLNLQWEHHSWQTSVSAFDILELQEADMWARPVYRHYVRCDKQQVCGLCGTIRHVTSCSCDVARARQCALLGACVAKSPRAMEQFKSLAGRV
jgi:hypothetical protein